MRSSNEDWALDLRNLKLLLENLDHLILVGDVNAKTANLQTVIEPQILYGASLVSVRSAKDTVIDTRGLNLIEILDLFSLLIVILISQQLGNLQ